MAPVLGLCPRAKHLLSDEELRKDIAQLQQLRQDRRFFNRQAELLTETPPEDNDEKTSRKAAAFEEF
jgi:hypothetical protein